MSNKDIVDKYTFLVMEYIHMVNNSDIFKSNDIGNEVFSIGLNALIHIFKLSLYITKNPDSATSYTQKGAYCYLEYVEQMYKSNLIHTLDNIEVVLFMYNKTLYEIYGPQHNAQSTSISNVLSLNETAYDETEDTKEQRVLLLHLERITHTILWINNPDLTCANRLDLAFRFLQKYLNTLISLEKKEPDTNVVSAIQCFQDHIWLNYDEYVEIVEEFYSQIKKNAKYRSTLLKEHIRTKQMYMIAYLSNKSLDEIKECEGFKKKMDIVKWFFNVSTI